MENEEGGVMEVEQEQEKEVQSQSQSQLPWIEKYRPKSLSELIAHEEIVNICECSALVSTRVDEEGRGSNPL